MGITQDFMGGDSEYVLRQQPLLDINHIQSFILDLNVLLLLSICYVN